MKNKSTLIAIIFFGALWGFTEATLGFAFHALSGIVPGIAGLFMFPIGFYFMARVFRETGSVRAVFATSAVTAAIKLADLAIPVLTPASTINPAICILLEGAAAAVFLNLVDIRKPALNLFGTLAISGSWRLIFVGILALLSPNAGILAAGTPVVIRFLVIDTIANGLLISAYLRFRNPQRVWVPSVSKLRPSLAIVALIAALGAELGTRLI
ncbi:hypothetical protein J7L01_01270 [bacterium]|nr:hypothetical protein [bacterium]